MGVVKNCPNSRMPGCARGIVMGSYQDCYEEKEIDISSINNSAAESNTSSLHTPQTAILKLRRLASWTVIKLGPNANWMTISGKPKTDPSWLVVVLFFEALVLVFPQLGDGPVVGRSRLCETSFFQG